MNRMNMTFDINEFTNRLEKHTLKDCYTNVYWNKYNTNFFSKIKGNRFYIYYKPAGNYNIFRTYLKGKITQENSDSYVSYRFGKESIAFIRSALLVAVFFFASYLLKNATVIFAAIFAALGVTSGLTLIIKSKKAKNRLELKLKDILLKEIPDNEIINFVPVDNI